MRILLILLIAIISAGCISQPLEFDENHAYEMLVKQASMDRFAGGKDQVACHEYLRDNLKPYCDKYIEQDFTQKVDDKDLHFKNLIGVINQKADKFLLLGSHYDNRPMCDKDKKENQKYSCPGANDGASSTSVLLELAKVFHSKKPNIGIVIVLFDGEDYGDDEDTMYFGSTYFANNLSVIGDLKINYGILLDMIGDKDLKIYIEKMSHYNAPELVDSLWTTADKLGYKSKFVPKTKHAIADDHLQLIEKGIKCIDIIDFDYPYWHKRSDTSDKCSAKSLKIVGDVIKEFVYNSKFEF